MLSKFQRAILCNFEDNFDLIETDDVIQRLWTGNWLSILEDPVLNIFENGKINFPTLDKFLNDGCLPDEEITQALAVGVASLNIFCEINWTGPRAALQDYPSVEKLPEDDAKIKAYAVSELTLNGEEIFPTIENPELLLVALRIFEKLPEAKEKMVLFWWQLRCYCIYQRILDENSPRLLGHIESTAQKLSNLQHTLSSQPRLQALLNLEISQAYLLYGKVNESEMCINKAKQIAALKLELKGALGKRTKFQSKDVAQLTLEVSVGDSESRVNAEETHGSTSLATPLHLDDDVRLESIQFLDIKDDEKTQLSSLEQLICLSTIRWMQRSQPKDALADEELLPFINALLSQKFGVWSVRIFALLIKCKIESTHKRTVERSMMQCEEVVNNFGENLNKVTSRLSYLWATGLPPVVEWRSQLADSLLNIGLVKAALDLYLKLQLWEEVIACYTILELRHKAAEIIQQQIDIKPTVKLYCLLGDATDDPSLYEKAWEFSNHRSSRAQRHWGNYLFAHKKYEECIPHYEKSCEINSLQLSVWLRLGYAALTCEKWDLAGNAYRRYTYLEPHSFEAWNNLAKVYVKQGNKLRAHKALSEALKYDYENWQVWENMVIVSLDAGYFDDVVRGYHRLMDLRGKHLDVEVLTLLVKAITNKLNDADGNPIDRIIPKTLELLGRVTSIHPTESKLWQIYADISPTPLLKAQRLLKAYGGFSRSGNWVADVLTCEAVLGLVTQLAEVALQAKAGIDATSEDNVTERNLKLSLLSSTKLTTQAVLHAVEKEAWDQLDDKVTQLRGLLDEIVKT